MNDTVKQKISQTVQQNMDVHGLLKLISLSIQHMDAIQNAIGSSQSFYKTIVF